MQREIKFRAWDRFQKGWIYSQLFEAGQPNVTWEGSFLWANVEPWQEFTGLHDKNGKEIYEGDIVAVREANQARRVVFFADCAFAMNESGDANKSSLPLIGYGLSVIGNIYESPELLAPSVQSGV